MNCCFSLSSLILPSNQLEVSLFVLQNIFAQLERSVAILAKRADEILEIGQDSGPALLLEVLVVDQLFADAIDLMILLIQLTSHLGARLDGVEVWLHVQASRDTVLVLLAIDIVLDRVAHVHLAEQEDGTGVRARRAFVVVHLVRRVEAFATADEQHLLIGWNRGQLVNGQL